MEHIFHSHQDPINLLSHSSDQQQSSKIICMQDLLWAHVNNQPNHIAVIDDDRSFTYRELFDTGLALATQLHFLGVQPSDLVGVYVEPAAELMQSVWGILLSGSAYLPLSPEYPVDRVRYMIDDARIKIVVTQKKLKPRLAALLTDNIKIVTIEDTNHFAKNERSHSDFISTSSPQDLAYVIYTSGSTGKPKGVMIDHGNIVNQMLWLQNTFHLNNQSRILQKTPISFDAAQWEILSPVCGCTVVMSTPGAYKDPYKLIKLIIHNKVTILQCVPTLLQALLDTDEFQQCETLTHIFSGGEALSKNLAMACTQTFPSTTLVNLYGPTECTINTSAFIVDPNTAADGPNTIPIGKPIENTQYYILNDTQKMLGVGEIGELYIGGQGVAQGYLHQPQLTTQKFVRLYKTGDLAHWNADGTVQYVGRSDNQVKLRGFRIELDEIKSIIETHHWIKKAAVILKNNSETKHQSLVAYIELNSKEAALMDQGNHDAHHQSKESKAQVMMQLAHAGCRNTADFDSRQVIDLLGKTPTEKQMQTAFARKSYRYFDGEKIERHHILQLLDNDNTSATKAITLEQLTFANFSEILRYFGEYISHERLLPKYAYASPGALYATQMYIELHQVCGLPSGYYYYHPVNHQLICIAKTATHPQPEIKIHFIGKKSAIEPIYKNNIQEVLEIETGHMIGLFEKVLSEYGLCITAADCLNGSKKHFAVSEEDFYLGAFQIVSGEQPTMEDNVDIYVQTHAEKISALKAATYLYKNGDLEKISDDIILKKHTIAINQEVYDRSAFGVTVVSKSKNAWMHYIDLGRKLQKLQMNDLNIGLMSSGYSSKTGNDLPSAKRISEIIGNTVSSSYFFIGGGISDKQLSDRGMREDAVHMRGPAEILRDDLINFLPDHMLPNKIIVLNAMPLTANGKIDIKALEKLQDESAVKPHIAPRTTIEKQLTAIWQKEMKQESISVDDNFFSLGGNSLIAVSMTYKINETFKISLELQTLFQYPTIEKLAKKLEKEKTETLSRLVPLQTDGIQNPIFCWPGLGGFCMNFHLLTKWLGNDQPFFGIQARGINPDETAYTTIEEMAATDIQLIKKIQPQGPYSLWGYSFGARVAYETAFQLEQMGDRIKQVVLMAPGSPAVTLKNTSCNIHEASYANKVYVVILISVFLGRIAQDTIDASMQIQCEADLVQFIVSKRPEFDLGLMKRIIQVVSVTYSFQYSLLTLTEKRIRAPIYVFKANGDECSFIEEARDIAFSLIQLQADHYNILKADGIEELTRKMSAIKQSAVSVV